MSELVDIRIPEDQREGTELELGSWLKAVGDAVEKDEPLAELVTDKAVVELPAPCAGRLAEILVEPETSITALDTVLGRIDASGATARSAASPREEPEPVHPGAPESEAASPAPGSGLSTPRSPSARRARRARGAGRAPEPPDRPAPHPAVLRFARARGVSLDALRGAGAGGRVTAADVRAAAGEPRGASPAPVSREKTGAAPPRAPAEMGPTRWIRHDPMRRSIARNMAESVRVAPHVTAVFECDLGRVIAHRDARKTDFAARGVKLTFSAYFVQAAVAAIRAVPEVNSRWHDDGLEVFEAAHVGVGTALEDRGLVVPVVKNAQELDLEATARVLGGLIEKARAGKLAAADMRGSTFTISNHGVTGSLMASPIIIQQPESAILGIGKLERRPVAVEDRIEVRPRMYVTLTIDHRVLDAFHTNRFLGAFCETIEGWPEP